MTNSLKYVMTYDIRMILLEKLFVKTSYLEFVRLPKPGFSNTCVKAAALGIGYRHVWGGYSEGKPDFKPYNRTLTCV